MAKVNRVRLLSSDCQIFEVDIQVVVMSAYIMKRLKKVRFEELVMVPPPEPMAGATLLKVLQWMEYHRYDPVPPKKNKQARPPKKYATDWDFQFFNSIDPATFIGMIRIATSMRIQALIDVTDEVIAKKVSGKAVDQLFENFRFENNEENMKKFGIF